MSQATIAHGTELAVKQWATTNPDPAQAIAELRRNIEQPHMSAVILFCSSRYDLSALAGEIRKSFSVPVVGCTTAGEIGPDGYQESSIVGFSLASSKLEVRSFGIEHLQSLGPGHFEGLSETVHGRLAKLRETEPTTKAFALLLVDGLSVMEEQLVAPLYRFLGQIPLIGGSAGDDQSFEKTYVYSNGEFRADAATVAVFFTSLPFEIFKTQHFVPTDRKLVITGAKPAQRIVTEINGKPAAREYAHQLGLEIEELKPMVFSRYPVMLRIGGEYYVRSIQKVNDDGSLTFFCAIDEGLVLTLCSGVDLVSNLDAALQDATNRVPNAQVVIGCECILRRLEVIEKNLTEDFARLIAKYHVIGFHTYGEQYNAVHVNQTFTGVVIGS